MNLVGKIFTVLILVMSIFFGAFTVLVYATHKNWKLVVDNPNPVGEQKLGLKQQLDGARKHNDELTNQKNKYKEDLANEKKAKEQAVTKLENEKAVVKAERDRLQKERDDLILNQRELVATMKSTQEASLALRTEVKALRVNIKAAHQARDAYFNEVTRKTDDLHQLVNEVKRLQERNRELAGQFANAQEVLRKFGLVGEPGRYTKIAPTREGVVLAVTGGGKLVTISIGSDDGLLEGHQLEVIRFSGGLRKYVGKIEVVETRPDKAVCKVDPKFLTSPMQKGDRVISNLRPPKDPIRGR